MQKFRNFIWSLLAGVLMTLSVYLTFTTARWLNRGEGLHFWNTTSVVHEVQSLSELVTVKYVMDKVVVLEDVKWYGESRVLLLAQGVVKAGIDLKRLKPEDVSISGKTITIRLPPPQVLDAYLDDKQSHVIDHTTGWKVDFIIAEDSEYGHAALARRKAIDMAGNAVYVASAEDVLLAKLQWAKMSGSERQLQDAAGIVSTQAENLDVAYIENWVRKLGLEEQWDVVRQRR